MAQWDQNGNGAIDYDDGWTQADVDNVNYYCDYDENGVTDACEVHQCITDFENQYRDDMCPGYGHIACDCPF